MNAQAGSQFPVKYFAEPTETHVSLGRPVRGLLFAILAGAVAGIVVLTGSEHDAKTVVVSAAVAALWAVIVTGIRVAAQWERGVVLRLGKFSSVKGPGVMFIIPFLDFVRFVDTRVLAMNIPNQKVITKDNVSAEVDGVLFFLVSDAEKAVVSIQDYRFAIAQYAQASLRDVVGGLSLDELLIEREQIQQRIRDVVEARIREWGVHVDSIRLLDINITEDLKKMMSRQASAEREKRATITKAEGDRMAADNLAKAAATMIASSGAMQLRMLQTIDGLGASSANTVVLFPVELTEALRSLGSVLAAKRLMEDGKSQT